MSPVPAGFEAIRHSSGVLDGNQLQAASAAVTVGVSGGQTLVTKGPAELNGCYIYDAQEAAWAAVEAAHAGCWIQGNYAVTACFWSALVTWMLRGLAASWTGMVSVSTPAA